MHAGKRQGVSSRTRYPNAYILLCNSKEMKYAMLTNDEARCCMQAPCLQPRTHLLVVTLCFNPLPIRLWKLESGCRKDTDKLVSAGGDLRLMDCPNWPNWD